MDLLFSNIQNLAQKIGVEKGKFIGQIRLSGAPKMSQNFKKIFRLL